MKREREKKCKVFDWFLFASDTAAAAAIEKVANIKLKKKWRKQKIDVKMEYRKHNVEIAKKLSQKVANDEGERRKR